LNTIPHFHKPGELAQTEKDKMGRLENISRTSSMIILTAIVGDFEFVI
jgi:hypothetical protein